MSADILRQAASLMRERANATAAPHHPYGDRNMQIVDTDADWSLEINDYVGGEMGEHAASWHPSVALAVADWLDMQAGCVQNYGPNAESPWVKPHTQMALSVANTYLGGAA